MKYFVIAGEASGDMHAAALVKELLSRDVAAEVAGMGGDSMQAAGCRLVQHCRNMAFMGPPRFSRRCAVRTIVFC